MRSQKGNNAYIFPGIGKGAIFSGATRLDSSDMICASR
jgi:malic enzyme